MTGGRAAVLTAMLIALAGCIDKGALRRPSGAGGSMAGAGGGSAGSGGVAGSAGVGGGAGTETTGSAGARTCMGDTDCPSGFCADGVCCNVACKGACLSCSQPGYAGICLPMPEGTPDPHGTCIPEPPCGRTGACDGGGGCAKAPLLRSCSSPRCEGARLLISTGICDGLGSCAAPTTIDCSPGRCIAGTCTTFCVSAADCAVGHACVNSSCGTKTDGQPCSVDTECQHDHCVDGVCCDQACLGACRSCGLASSLGRCTPVATGGPDPRGLCHNQGQSSCGANGKCDGAGGCARYPVGTICAAESCAADLYTPPSTCSATGQCLAPDALSCIPFRCGANRCFSACSSDAECVPPSTCIAGSCGLKLLGVRCSTASECLSTHCEQGICCASSCSGRCQTCASPVSLGICTAVPAGMVDPQGICADAGSSSCAGDGFCDGHGACRPTPAGTVCGSAACPPGSSSRTPAPTCDGNGTCQTPAATSCGPYYCAEAAPICESSCSSAGRCQSGYQCDLETGMCVKQ